jgi:predicted SAM-dependent methyltransferase
LRNESKALFRNKVKTILKKQGLLGVATACVRLLRRIKSRLNDGKMIRTYLDNHQVKKLHIGAGEHVLRGWLNSDLYPYQREVIYFDATKVFPFEHRTFDYVFSEHMIEHVTFTQGLDMLKECHRVLKLGGKIRVATPDLLFLIELYKVSKTPLERAYIEWAVDTQVQGAFSYKDTYVINNFFRDWGHKFIYDEKVLREALENVGFSDVVRREVHESPDPELRGLEFKSKLPDGFLNLETMVLEAVKRNS